MPKRSPRFGLTVIELLVALTIIATLIALLCVAVQGIRAQAARTECQNKLKQIALAMTNFDAQHKRLPPAVSTNTADFWYLSWMGRILPQLDQAAAADVEAEFRRIYSPWGYSWRPDFGGQPPHKGFAQAPGIFRCPADGRGMIANLHLGSGNFSDAGFTSYLGVCGTDGTAADGLLVVGKSMRLNQVPDGASNTILVSERPPYQDWWAGMWYAGSGYDGRGTGDVVLGAREIGYAGNLGCPPTDVGFRAGRLDTPCDQVHFWSLHSGGANFAFADGSVRFLADSADSYLPALATRDGGEQIPEL